MPNTVADQSCTEIDTPNFAAMAEAAGIRRLVSGVGPQGQPGEHPRPPGTCQSCGAYFPGHGGCHFGHCCFGPRDNSNRDVWIRR
jgi:hypothetical protein